MAIVLASSSPRRRRLLSRAGVGHRVVVRAVDETPPDGLAPRDAAAALAARKARAALPEAGSDPILAADTIVVLDGEILGKPRDEEDARRTLSLLSGREHEVHTAVCLLDPATGVERGRVVTTRVRFRALDRGEIEDYVRTGEPMDKAGAYGIQGAGGSFVAEVRGSRDNVIGLPVAEVLDLIAEAS